MRYSALVILSVLLVCGCATRPHIIPSTVGPDFPRTDSYYPAEAYEVGQEGTTTVHYCVDANGHLVEAPTVQQSSGHDVLDQAALKLASAGDGHYRPAYENGRPLASCSTFRVKFQMRIDPRFPILSRRAIALNAEFRARAERMEAQLRSIERPPDLTAFVPGNQDQMARLHRFADNAPPLLKQYVGDVSELIARTDELGRAPDVTEAERTAFSKDWQLKRAEMTQMREALLDTQILIATINELIDHVQNSQPTPSGTSEHIEASPRQRTNIDRLIERARAEYATKLEPVTERIRHLQVAAQKPAGDTIQLLSSGGDQYSATSTPQVSFPLPLADPNGKPVSCTYPEMARRSSTEGTTVVRLQIDATGHAATPSVIRTSGSDELDSAALSCIAGMRFQPAMQGPVPVVSVVRYTMNWRLNWDPPKAKSCGDIRVAEAEQRPPTAPEGQAANGTVVCTCYEESGMSREPELIQSSGSAKLDQGAIVLARKAGAQPRPPGHPGCFGFHIKFELRDPPKPVPQNN